MSKVKCNKCGKVMTDENGIKVSGLEIKLAIVEGSSNIDIDFLQKQLGPFKMGKTYSICYECWMFANGLVP